MFKSQVDTHLGCLPSAMRCAKGRDSSTEKVQLLPKKLTVSHSSSKLQCSESYEFFPKYKLGY